MATIRRTITDTEKRIAAKLKATRKERGLTQTGLAELLNERLEKNVYQSTINDLESGMVRLHGEMIVVLCEVLKLDANELLGVPPMDLLTVNPKLLDAQRLLSQLKPQQRRLVIENLVQDIKDVLKE